MLFRLSAHGAKLDSVRNDGSENGVTGDVLAARSPELEAQTWLRVRELRASTPAWAWPDVDPESLPQPGCVVSDPPPPGPKFRRLHEWFAAQQDARLQVDLGVLDELVDGGLPAAATTGKCAREWWTNNPRKHYSRAWVNAGYAASGNSTGATRCFVRGTTPILTRAQAIEPRLYWLPHLAVCATSTHRADPFDRATSVYIIRLLDVGLYKVGVSAAEALTRRIQSHGVGGRRVEVLQTVALAHRSCARAIEAVALNLTEPWRRFDDRWRAAGGGYSETWSDVGPVPDLCDLAERMNPAIISGIQR